MIVFGQLADKFDLQTSAMPLSVKGLNTLTDD